MMSYPIDPLSLFDRAVDAVINGSLKTLDDLLTAHPDLATSHSVKKHRATLLHYVAANGIEADKQRTPVNIVEIAMMLLEAGANPNRTSNIYGGGAGSTPLVGLVSSSHPADAGVMSDLVRLFCQHGNPDGVASDGLPLRTAISFRQRDAMRALSDSGARTKHLVTAAATGKLDTMHQLYEQSSAPYHDSFGQSWETQQAIREHALTVAAMNGQLDVVDYLVEQGVDINAKASSSGDSALIEAIMGGYTQIVAYLLEQGADVAHITQYPTGDDAMDTVIAEYK